MARNRRDQYRSLDPIALLAEIRATQEELLGKTVQVGEPRATHRRAHRRYKTRVRMPSKLDPHIATIEDWLAAQPQLTALTIVGRLSEKCPEQFGTRQHSIVQRLLRALRKTK
jgi:hypothetical protein